MPQAIHAPRQRATPHPEARIPESKVVDPATGALPVACALRRGGPPVAHFAPLTFFVFTTLDSFALSDGLILGLNINDKWKEYK